VIALCGGRDRVDEAKLAALLGVDGVRRASAEEVRAITGYPIGGTPPFAHARPLRVLIDPGLLRYDELWAGAGTGEAVVRVYARDLVRASGGEVAAIAG
jgi:prolyl-tRNA editing enzyme YbaK/EbsC (Cys-tRNA(Pro) deacylase)